MVSGKTDKQFVICIENRDYTASLELRKIYQVVPDGAARLHGLVRITDETGEDYLYPMEFFITIELPEDVQEAMAAVL